MLANTRPSPRQIAPYPRKDHYPRRTYIRPAKEVVASSWDTMSGSVAASPNASCAAASPNPLRARHPQTRRRRGTEAVLGCARNCPRLRRDRPTRPNDSSPRPRSARAPSRTESEPEMVIVTPSGPQLGVHPADELMRVGPPFGSTNRWIEAFGSRRRRSGPGTAPKRVRLVRLDPISSSPRGSGRRSSPATRPGTPHACA